MGSQVVKGGKKMNLADAFLNVLGVCFSGLLTGLAYLIYQHKFMKDRI